MYLAYVVISYVNILVSSFLIILYIKHNLCFFFYVPICPILILCIILLFLLTDYSTSHL